MDSHDVQARVCCEADAILARFAAASPDALGDVADELDRRLAAYAEGPEFACMVVGELLSRIEGRLRLARRPPPVSSLGVLAGGDALDRAAYAGL